MCNCKKKEETLQPKYTPIPVPPTPEVVEEEIKPQEDNNPNVEYPLIED